MDRRALAELVGAVVLTLAALVALLVLNGY
jgi:hypothetical protein